MRYTKSEDPQRLGEWLLTFYLATAPVYWLPGIQIEGIQFIKFVLIASACGVIWYEALQKDHLIFPNGLTGLTGFYIVILASFPGLFRAASMEAMLSTLTNFAQCFIFLWTLYIFYIRGGSVIRVFRNASIAIVLISILPITNWLFGIPDWSYTSEDPLWLTGFTSKKTGWSEGIALYLPVVATFPFFSDKNKVAAYSYSLAGIIIILGAQTVSGGRGGLLASLVSLGLLSLLFLPRKLIATLVGAITGIAFSYRGFLYQNLRFELLESWSYESINRFSSYRLEGYIAAYDLFWMKPFGHGFGQSVQILMQEYQQSTELHNVWLRLLADGGILLLLGTLSVVFSLLVTSLKSVKLKILKRIRLRIPTILVVKQRQVLLVICISVLFAGLSISMFAPSTPFGVFQNSAIWWGSAGTIAGIASSKWTLFRESKYTT